MAMAGEGPRCNVEPPDLKLGVDGLRELLAIEWRRLEVAERIENERDLVFPETTIIIRDIQKLMTAIEEAENVDTAAPEPEEQEPIETAASRFIAGLGRG